MRLRSARAHETGNPIHPDPWKRTQSTRFGRARRPTAPAYPKVTMSEKMAMMTKVMIQRFSMAIRCMVAFIVVH
jgi:hypothetical protein